MDQPNLSRDLNDSVLPSSTLATVSLISAILGFTLFPLVGGIVALVTGYLARRETRASPPQASGDGMAVAGIIMGWLQVLILGILICCFAFIVLSYFIWARFGR